MKNWFEVSRKGLRELQAGKPKHFILRELIQNAWDEDITECRVSTIWEKGVATISVGDDSPEGFRDLADAFTLFAPTHKRADVTKRGRFNLGEKQVLAIADYARIKTTKGSVIFTPDGRSRSRSKTDAGSIVDLTVKMTRKDYDEMLDWMQYVLPPEHCDTYLNGEIIPQRFATVTTNVGYLRTEVEHDDGFLRVTHRTADIHIHNPIQFADGRESKSFLYELGLPVCEIECDFSIDVQQKVPLAADRESVPPVYLTRLYAEVLNVTHDRLRDDESSNVWIRDAMTTAFVESTAVKSIVMKRFGSKVVVASPSDPAANDEALSRGYRVVHGSEMSALEWNQVRSAEAIPSSTSMFGRSTVKSAHVDETSDMHVIRMLVKKIAALCLSLPVQALFRSWDSTVAAQYGSRTLTFNVKNLGADWFHVDKGFTQQQLDLIIHELAHEDGMHTQMNYLDALSKIGSMLTIVALEDPDFFDIDLMLKQLKKEQKVKA